MSAQQITPPVAVARGVLIDAVLWGLGSGVLFVLYQAMGAGTTMSDVPDQSGNAQLLWWGTHAFFACAGSLAAVAAGGVALVHEGRSPSRAAALMVLFIAIFDALVIVIMAGVSDVSPSMLAANLVGAGIGLLAGIIFLLQRGVPDDFNPYDTGHRTSSRTTRSWGSR